MDFLHALLFLFIILYFSYVIKANYFYLVFIAVVFLFFFVSLLFLDPMQFINTIVNQILLKPWGLIILIILGILMIFTAKPKKKT